MQKSLAWQKELENIKKSKEAQSTVTKSLVGQVHLIADELVAVSNTHATELKALNEDVTTAVNSASSALQSATGALQGHLEHGTEIDKIKKNQKKQIKVVEANTKRCAKNASEQHRKELEQCQKVLICKGIAPTVVGRESYTDLETSLFNALKKIGIKQGKVGIGYIRRLPGPMERRSGSGSGSSRLRGQEGPKLLRVELASLGDKIKIFDAMAGYGNTASLGMSFATEIPKYALAKFRKYGRLAKAIRQFEENAKTRVIIPRGKLLPEIQIKTKGSTEPYTPASEPLIDKARKMLSDTNDDALLDDDENMS